MELITFYSCYHKYVLYKMTSYLFNADVVFAVIVRVFDVDAAVVT